MQRRLIIGALALFVLLDVVLVTLAVRQSSAPATPVTANGREGTTSTPSPEQDSGFASPTPEGVAAITFLSLASDGTVVRAPRGDCRGSTSPTVEISDDTGRSFKSGWVPGLREILGVRADSARAITLTGLDTGCRLGTYSSDDGGRSWDTSTGGAGWHLGPDAQAAKVGSPAGSHATPCPPLSLTTAPHGVVRLLCDGGRIHGSDDLGLTWQFLGRLPGAVAIRYTSSGAGLALARQPGCGAAILETIDGGNTWSRVTCLPGDEPRALASQGAVVVAQVGDRPFVSSDSGGRWHPARA